MVVFRIMRTMVECFASNTRGSLKRLPITGGPRGVFICGDTRAPPPQQWLTKFYIFIRRQSEFSFRMRRLFGMRPKKKKRKNQNFGHGQGRRRIGKPWRKRWKRREIRVPCPGNSRESWYLSRAGICRPPVPGLCYTLLYFGELNPRLLLFSSTLKKTRKITNLK